MVISSPDEPGKNLISPPPAEGGGLRGGGYNRLKFYLIHPHPGPLPSREREIFDFLRNHQVLLFFQADYCYMCPLLDRTPVIRSSNVLASSSALPKDLKTDSII